MSTIPAHVTPSSAVTDRPRTRSILLALGVVGAVLAMTIAGAVLAAGSLNGPEHSAVKKFPAPAGATFGTFKIGEDVPTSFGAMSVKHAERVNGLTAKALAGMTHGVNGLVREKQSRIAATVTVTNLLDKLHAYTPAHFTLRTSEGGKPLRLAGASIQPGKLQPDASIDFRVDFNAPRTAKHFWIDFKDPGRAKPLTVDLGRVKALPGDTRSPSQAAQDALLSTSTDHAGHGE